MHVLIVTIGSHGDVNPFIAIGRALRDRGHEAVFVTNPYFKGQVEEAGLSFIGVGESLDIKRIDQTMPNLMHERKGPAVVLEHLLAKFSIDSYPVLRDLVRGRAFDAVVHHHIALAAAWAAESQGVPTATVVLAPLMWLSKGDRFTPQSWSPVYPALWMLWLLHLLKTPALALILGPMIRRVRRELGLSRRSGGEYARITRGGTLNLGMWSPALRGPIPGDPPNSHICGFPWHDRHAQQEAITDAVEAFLRDGSPPVLFTLGTVAVHVAGDFYVHAAEACRILGRRGLLLVGPGREPPRNLPPGTAAFEYIPFSRVMPRCVLIVHHGGIGTTAQAIRAGRPMLVIPHAHDQFDNAARVIRLGIATSIPRPRVTARRLADALRVLLQDQRYHDRAQLLAPQASPDGAKVAAEVISGLG